MMPIATDGTQLPLDSLGIENYYYDDNDNVIAKTVKYPARKTGELTTYFQQNTYDDDNRITHTSKWQPIGGEDSFSTTWNTGLTSEELLGLSSNDQISLPLVATGEYAFFVDWGDGVVDYITAYNQAEVTHTYPAPGIYEVRISGVCTGFRFNNGGDAVKLTKISHWGTLKLGNLNGYFYGCSNLVITATDTLDLTGTTTLKNAFRSCASIVTIPNITSWNFFNVTTLEGIFQDAVLFDQDLNGIDTSSVTTLKSAFEGALDFNGNIDALNTSACTDMSFCFANTNKFNKSVTTWDFSNVTTVESMLNTAIAYNKSLAGINTSSITTFKNFLNGAVSFNSSVSGFDFSSCDDCTGMFRGCESFNHSFVGWVNFGSVQKLDEMLKDAFLWNQSLADLDISGVISAPDMLANSAFDTENYDLLLVSWSQQSVQPNVNLGIGTTQYNEAYTPYRTVLTNSPNSWTINDGGAIVDSSAFISVWDTEAVGARPDNTIIKLPLVAVGVYDFYVDWGDGKVDHIISYDQAQVTHTYAHSGVYTLTITGTMIGFVFRDQDYFDCITEISQWGCLKFGNAATTGGFFYNAWNMLITATDAPDLTGITSFKEAFFDAAIITVPGIETWDVSAITDMSFCFKYCWQFDQTLNGWDVSNVLTMEGMFWGCQAFNSSLSSWSTLALTNTKQMFSDAEAFNQSLNNFTMNLVTTTEGMFESAVAFNNDIYLWTLPACLSMANMFHNASSFNKNFVTTGHWHTPNVQDFSGFMLQATAFSMPLDLLDVSSCRNFSQMFRQATSFNQPLPDWDFSNAESCFEMFRLCPFNQDTPWDFSNGPDLSFMFYQSGYNTPPGFDVGACSIFDYMFGESSFNQDLSGFDMSNATSCEGMFEGNTAIDQNFGSWNIANVTNLSRFLEGATLSNTNYNALLVGWSAQTVHHNLTFDGGNSHYSGAGVAARAILTGAPNNWTITDGGTP